MIEPVVKAHLRPYFGLHRSRFPHCSSFGRVADSHPDRPLTHFLQQAPTGQWLLVAMAWSKLDNLNGHDDSWKNSEGACELCSLPYSTLCHE